MSLTVKKFLILSLILAHSFGAWIASLYALKYPERVEHLILAGESNKLE